VGGGRWWSWVAVGSCRWLEKWPETARRTAHVKTGYAHFGPSWELLWGFWWLPMVGEVLGVLGVATGGGNRPENGRKIAEKARKLRHTVEQPNAKADRGGGLG